MVLLAVVLLLWRGEDTVPADSALSDQCGDPPTEATRMTYTAADGFRLGGAIVGDPAAPTAVVLRHGAGPP